MLAQSNGLIVCPNKQGELKIPEPLVTTHLQHLLNRKVAIWTSPGYPDIIHQNRRAGSPAATFIDLRTPCKHRLHHEATFRPQGMDMNQILKGEQIVEISDQGMILLPDSVATLFQQENTRAKVLVLTRNQCREIDGFALSFQKRYPGNLHG